MSRSSSRSRDEVSLAGGSDVESDREEVNEGGGEQQGAVGGSEEGDFHAREEEAKRQLKNHKFGAVLLPILTSLYALAGQVGGAVSTPNLHTIADLMAQVEDVTENAVDRAEAGMARADDLTNQVRRSLFTSQLDAETVVQPPAEFAKTDFFTVEKMSRLQAIRYYWPQAQFAGNASDKITVVQFLETMTRGANRLQGKLSEADFRDLLLSKTTGRAHESLTLWLQGNLSMKGIYAKMLSTYDAREAPGEAQEKLEKLNSSYFNSLSNLSLRIETLARRASLSVRGRASQEVLFNCMAIKTLEAAIPEPYRSNIVSMRLQLEQAADDSLSFFEFSSIVEKYDRQVTAELRKKYVPPRERKPAKKEGQFASVEASGSAGGKKEGSGQPKQGQKPNGGGKKGNPNNDGKKTGTAEMNSSQADSRSPPVVKPNWHSDKGGNTSTSYVTPNKDGVCTKCSGAHPSNACTNVDGPIARYSCRICKLGLHHMEKCCPFRKPQGQGGASSSPHQGNPQARN